MNVVATREGLARVEADELVVVDVAYPDVGVLLRESGSLAAVESARVLRRHPLSESVAQVIAPLPRPSAVWGVGLNYHSRVKITGRAVPTAPILFLAAPSAVCAPGQDIPLPEGETTEFDYEGEVAIVIGRRLYRGTETDVWPHVAGITAANDVTARDVMKATTIPTLAKSFRGCKPLGASVRDIGDLPDRDDIGVRTLVNGERSQDGRTSDLIFSVCELVARISHYAALEPGDVVLTGTPVGTGQDRRTFLQVGDVVTVEVEGVLPLRNAIKSGPVAGIRAAHTEAVVPI